jgi:hypothetical protein
MRIGCIGAGATGKTSLLKAVSEKTGMTYHSSVNRTAFAKFNQTQLTHTALAPAMRWDIQRRSFSMKIEQDELNLPGLYERTLLDHFMYSLIYCYEAIDDETLQKMQLQVIKNLQDYDVLLFFPIYTWDSELNDGFRDATTSNRTLQELIVSGFLSRHGFDTKVRWVPDIPLYARIDWMIDMLGIK